MNKTQPVDVYIKDEGEFLTVIFSDKALKVVDNYPVMKENLDGNKFDIAAESSENMVKWAKLNELTFDSEI